MSIKNLVRKEILNISPYIPPKPLKELEKELKSTDLTILTSNENPVSISGDVIKAIQNELKNINRYPDGGAFYLKKLLSRKMKISPLNIIFGNGGDEVLSMICETFLNPGEEVILGRPTFGAYEIFSRIMGGVPVFHELADCKFNLKEILEKINANTKIIFICNPNNPTGTIVTQKEVENFLKNVPENILVVFDEAYMEYVDSKFFPSTIDFIKNGYKNVIVIRTFSKIYSMAGLRIGYGIGDCETIKYIDLVRKPYNVNSLAQTGACISLLNPKILSQTRKLNKSGKKFLYDSFKKMGLYYIPTEANFILLRTGLKSEILYNRFLSYGILIRPGHVFGYPEFIRVTIGTEKENKKFIKALNAIIRKVF